MYYFFNMYFHVQVPLNKQVRLSSKIVRTKNKTKFNIVNKRFKMN